MKKGSRVKYRNGSKPNILNPNCSKCCRGFVQTQWFEKHLPLDGYWKETKSSRRNWSVMNFVQLPRGRRCLYMWKKQTEQGSKILDMHKTLFPLMGLFFFQRHMSRCIIMILYSVTVGLQWISEDLKFGMVQIIVMVSKVPVGHNRRSGDENASDIS